MTEHKGSCFILPATICKWLRERKWNLRWLLNDLDSAAIYFPPHHVCTRGRSPSAEPPGARNNKLFSKSFQSSGLVDGGLLEQGGCQKSQLAGSALRNPAAYQLLRLSTVMTGGPPPRELNDRNSVVGKKKKISPYTRIFFFTPFKPPWHVIAHVWSFFQGTQHISCCSGPCVSSPNTSNIYSLL